MNTQDKAAQSQPILSAGVASWQDRMAAHYSQNKSVACLPQAAFMQLEIDALRAALASSPSPIEQAAPERPSTKQLIAQLEDTEKWTVAEQNEFATFLARFPNESSQGIISLGSAWKHGRASVAAPQQAQTDLSKQLRGIAANGDTGSYVHVRPQMLNAAAYEIERYYGGMLAWKKTAEAKDAGRTAIPEAGQSVPKGWREKLKKIAEWLKSSAQDQQVGPDEWAPASQFDYELGQAGAEIEEIISVCTKSCRGDCALCRNWYERHLATMSTVASVAGGEPK